MRLLIASVVMAAGSCSSPANDDGCIRMENSVVKPSPTKRVKTSQPKPTGKGWHWDEDDCRWER